MHSKRLKNWSSKIFAILVEHKIAVLLIIFISLTIWHKVLFQVPVGEGYYYFKAEQNIFLSNISPKDFVNHDMFAQLIFPVLITFFGDNLFLYMLFQLIVFLGVYLCFYFSLNSIISNKWVSLTSTIFFIGSFVGSFTMVAAANYQRFIQRVPNLIPLFISFALLVYFLRTRKLKFGIYSYLLFFFTTLLARFSTFLLPLFVFYPILDYLFSENKKRNIKNFIIPVIFTGTAFFFSILTELKPSVGVLKFVLTHPKIIEKTLYQLPSTLVPYELVKFIANHQNPILLYPYTQLRGYLLVIVVVILIISVIRFHQKHSPIFKLYVTSILSLLAVSFITMYNYDGSPSPLTNFGEDRIYFIPSILSSFLLAVLIWLCFYKKQRLYKIATVIIVTCYLVLNTMQIWPKMDQNQYISTEMKNFIAYAKNIAAKNNTKVIIAPSHLAWPGIFISRLYIKDLIIDTGYEGWEKRIGSIPTENITVIDYDYERANLEASLSANGKVIDLTSEFRKTRKFTFK